MQSGIEYEIRVRSNKDKTIVSEEIRGVRWEERLTAESMFLRTEPNQSRLPDSERARNGRPRIGLVRLLR